MTGRDWTKSPASKDGKQIVEGDAVSRSAQMRLRTGLSLLVRRCRRPLGLAFLILSGLWVLRHLWKDSVESFGHDIAIVPPSHWICAGVAAQGAAMALGGYRRFSAGRNPRAKRSASAGGPRGAPSTGEGPSFYACGFALAIVLAASTLTLFDPFLWERYLSVPPYDVLGDIAKLMIGGWVIYFACTFLPLPIFRIGRRQIAIGDPATAVLHLVLPAGVLLMAAVAIYAVLSPVTALGLPEVAAALIAACSLARLSGVPHGLGVFEMTFAIGLPEVALHDLLPALIALRLFILAALSVHAPRRVAGDQHTRFPCPSN